MVPDKPETLMVEGYGVALPTLGMVTTAVLVTEVVVVIVALTFRRKLERAFSEPSLTARAIVDVPDCPAIGVKVTVRLAPEPPKTTLASGINVGLEEEPLR